AAAAPPAAAAAAQRADVAPELAPVPASQRPAAPATGDTHNTIADVRVEGLRRVDAEAALAGLKLQRGKTFDAAVATDDLRRMWATGFFRDVALFKEATAGGLQLIYTVVEKPYVRHVRLEGLDALSEDDVKAVINVKPYTVLNLDLLKRNAEKIKDLYVGKSYYLATADYRVEPVGDRGFEVDIVFDVHERDKVMVRQITFLGNKHVSAEDLKAAMQTREGSELSFLSQAGTYKEEYFQTDLMRLQSLYYDRGYVTVKLGEPTATISKDRRYIYLSIPVEEGEQYRIGSISFSGDVDLQDAAGETIIDANLLRSKLHLEDGAVFNRTELFGDIQGLTDI
ncbi:MAG: outer membrane protein assembly factor BamA, partial [Deltaproteobacteria bacterium]